MDALIIADDLSGAADCAAASGTGAIVTLSGSADVDAPVVAVDIDSRDLAPAAAADRAGTVARTGADSLIYQKLDSTLRGNWPAELAAIAAELTRARGKAPLVLLCPAFPERGRSVVRGHVRVEGRSLASGSIATMLGGAGLEGSDVPRGLMPSELRAALDAVAAAGRIAVCDAESRADLNALAKISLDYTNVFWAGSAGLMSSLATQLGWRAPQEPLPPAPGCVLVVVGSASDVSRTQVNRLAAVPGVKSILYPAETLAGRGGDHLGSAAAELATAARSARCVAVSIDAAPGASTGAALVAGLTRLLVPLLPHFGGLVVTGGETARSLLSGAGVHALRILGELEPGVPFGRTVGALERTIITKAGGFGTPDTLVHAFRALTQPAPDPGREPT